MFKIFAKYILVLLLGSGMTGIGVQTGLAAHVRDVLSSVRTSNSQAVQSSTKISSDPDDKLESTEKTEVSPDVDKIIEVTVTPGKGPAKVTRTSVEDVNETVEEKGASVEVTITKTPPAPILSLEKDLGSVASMMERPGFGLGNR